ncbi:PucR family transcriptional regulator ligand-binding domain-containing protein [Pseudomonas sp. ZM23]|uniref:PucR family transcriptional regulator ligand-binding domain-containing protein n=1 Tax=Pseudomonas triclosanedens TaxID=2961893 RepID=A0ABY7A4M0_9PSED|nr:PucR family transcriptional regulator [Pseudomonas triclosanedens]MCP8466419.1 PucR family transcriptional regulator ligand-binding domain-containing protein [Pseudomonas triclosanedens]MCP8473179.1 PucR family transcriptional regulator ligand-binding domain-containing protein [Pseudomonas triclosanedens]MCP8479057.1 PucR family transcriptional regulator ligand-binding domain-containing protein [Pseudomonas triclosanedens]WAI52167.1 PucR family transcriptional regulator ligand-binding domain
MSLSVEEILRLPGLESLVLRAGARNVHRSVRWSYVAENVGIADWVMGGELVFVTGINHTRDEANLLQLVREGVASGIAGIVILTGDEFIRRIPQSVIHLADVEGLPLIEQPYALKMVIVTHLIGTALVQMTQTKHSRRDILGQLLSGDFPSLEIVRQRARHLDLPLDVPRRLVALRLSGVDTLFREHSPEEAERALQLTRQRLLDHLENWQQGRVDRLPVVVQGDLFVLLLAEVERDELATLAGELRQDLAPLCAFLGLSARADSCAEYPRALLEARQALDVAEGLRPAAGLCDYRELGVLRLLRAIPERTVIDQFMKDTLGALSDAGRKQPYLLVETLDALIQEGGNALRAAQRLGIHRNTLNQRIARIENLSGQSLDDAQFRLNASVALLIWRMSNAPRHQ